jgi:hypothetical protein
VPFWLAAVVRGRHVLPGLQSRSLICLKFYESLARTPLGLSLALTLAGMFLISGKMQSPAVLINGNCHDFRTIASSRDGEARMREVMDRCKIHADQQQP